MGLWDDIKDLAGDAKDAVVDVFDGDDDAPEQPQVMGTRPQYQGGNAFRTVNPAYAQRETEFDKPLWMQGADPQSPYSSWDSDFLNRMFKQQDKLTDAGKMGDQFDQKNATGVVTWDHVTKSGKELKFGDILDKGKLVGNLYEDKTGTTADADLMMSQLLLEPEELAQIGEDRSPEERMRSVIEKVRENNNIEIPQAMSAAAQQQDVDKTQKGIQEAGGGLGDDLLATGLGFLGGAAIGTAGGPIGTIIGGVGGGLAAWLNRDDISEQAASAYEITRKAYNDGEGNFVGDTGSAARQWAGVAGRGLAPFSNLVRGAIDSDRGNGIGALQEEDRPGWAKPLDIAATVLDMGFTFGSRAGIAAYTGQMGAHSAGAVTELTAGGGMRWDAEAGEFRNVYRNEQGDISAANALGAWGSTGIDIAQLAMVRGIASKIKDPSQKYVGTEMAGGTVARVESRAGRSFYLDADGKALGSKVNLSQAFVPSEGVQILAAGGMARGAAAKGLRPGKTTHDDLYKASVDLQRASSPIKAALVNAVGEGTEEAVQEALDTWSFDHNVELQTLAEAYAYGAASGLGMGFAANYRTRDNDAKELRGLVERGFIDTHGALPADWDKTYKRMSPEQRKTYINSQMDPKEREMFREILGDEMILEGSSTAAGQGITNMINHFIQEESDRLTDKAGAPGDPVNRAAGKQIAPARARGNDGSIDIRSGVVADDALTAGPRGLLTYYKQRAKNLPLVLKTIETQLAEAKAEQARTAKGEDTSHADARVKQLEDMLDLWTRTKEFLPDIIDQVQRAVAIMVDEKQPMKVRIKELDGLNRKLDAYYRSDDDALALAASMLRLRSPYDNVGSFHVGAAAVSLADMKDGVEVKVETDWASLDVTTADFDGDRFTSSTGLALSADAFRRARAGTSWLATERKVDADGNQLPGASTLYKVAGLSPDVAIGTTAHYIHTAQYLPAIQGLPEAALSKFVDAVVQRYSPPNAPTYTMTQEMYGALEAILFTAKPKDPIKELMRYFATDQNASAMLVQYADQNRTNEPSVLVGMYRSYMDELQVQVNQHAASLVDPADRKGAAKAAAVTKRWNAPDQHRKVAPQQGATLLNTFFQYYGSKEMLRIGQVIRLSHVDYKDRGVSKADTNPLLDIAGREMRALAQGHIEDASKAGLNEFDIPARVRAMALDIADGNEALAFNLLSQSFGDVQFEGKDRIKSRPNVTVAQALTMSYVQQLRVDAAVPISRDPQLQAKLNLLETAANDARKGDKKTRSKGEMMILKDALGAFNLADLLGVGDTSKWATSGLLITGSIEQNIRRMMTLPREDAAALKRVMQRQEVSEASRPLYDDIVNFMVEVSNTESARIKDRNESASRAALEVRKIVREAMKTAKLPQTIEGVQKLLDTQDGQQILTALVSQTSIASFTDSTQGGKSIRDWVLEFFAVESDGRAEVLLWQNRAYDSIKLKTARERMKKRDKATFGNSKDEDEKEDDYVRQDDTLAALMQHLRQHSPTGLRDLQVAIGQATDRRSLEEWIADQQYSFNVPVLMYENSMAQFNPSLASGGWGVTGTNYGSAIRELLQPSKSFGKRITKQMNFRAINVRTAARLLSHRDSAQDHPEIKQLTTELESRLRGAVKTMHPNDMLDSMMRSQYVATDMHNKGKEHEAVAAYGSPQVTEGVQTGFADAFGDLANQLFDVRDVKDLQTRPELVFFTKSFIDDHGSPVAIPNLRDAAGNIDIFLVLEQIAKNGKTGLADLLTEAIMPRQYTFNRLTGQTSVVTTGPRTLQDLVTRRYDAAFKSNGPGRYTDKANAAFAAELSASVQSQDFTNAAAFERAWQAIALPRIMSSRGWSRKRVAAELEKVRGQLASAIRMAGFLQEQSPEDYDTALQVVVQDLVLNMNLAQNERARNRGKTAHYGVAARSASRKMFEEMMDTVLEGLRQENRTERIAFLSEALEKIEAHETGKARLSPAEVATLTAEITATGNMSTPMITLLESVLYDDPFSYLHFAYGQGDVITMEQQDAITDYLKKHPAIKNQINHDAKATEALTWFEEDGLARDAVQWPMLSRIVISHVVQDEATEAWSPTDKLQVFMKDTHLDPTYSLLMKEIFAPDSPLMKASKDIIARAERPEIFTADEVANSLAELIPTDGSVRWDQSIGAQTMANDANYAASAAGAAAPLHANSGKTVDALAMAAYTTVDKVPDASLLQTATLRLDPQGLIGADTSILEGAIGTVTANGVPVDLEVMVNARLEAPYQVITSERLELAAEKLGMGTVLEVKYFHPLMRPAAAEWTNSIYFDGVPAYSSSETNEFPSLIAALYNQANGILQLGTRFDLDAVKEGMPSVTKTYVDPNGNYDLVDSPDPSNYLLQLARTLSVTVNLGYPALGEQWMRAALKYVTMRSVVLYANGTVSSVHSYMAEQQADPAGMAARGPKMVQLSERTANSFYGETGTQGLRGFIMSNRVIAGSQAFSWSSLTPQQLEIVANMSKPVPLAQTSAARRSVLGAADIIKPAAFSDAVKDLVGLTTLMEQRDRAQIGRPRIIDKIGGSFTEMQTHQRTVANELGRRDGNSTFALPDEVEELLARVGHSRSEFSNDYSYHLILTKQGSINNGIVTPTNYKDVTRALGSLTFGDTAVIDLAELADIKTETLLDMVRVLTLSKVTISLRGVGANEHTRAVADFLRSTHDYATLVDQVDTFAPRESVNEYQLETAYESRLAEQGFRSGTSRLVALVPTGVIAPEFGAMAESQAYILDEDRRTVVSDVLIKQYPSVKATPVHQIDVAKVGKLLKRMKKDLLSAPVKGEIAGLSHADAVQDLMERIDNGLLPFNSKDLNLRKGMFQVFVVPAPLGSEMKIYLHRYGSKFTKESELDILANSGSTFLLGPTETEPDQTTVEGLVVGDTSTGASDMKLEVLSSHAWYGAKRIPLFGGDKGMYVKLPDDLKWVDSAISGEFRPQEISNSADAMKKLNMLDMAGTFSQVAEALGFDNMPILFKGFYGVEYDGSVGHKSMMGELRAGLNRVRKDSSMTYSRAGRTSVNLARSINGQHSPLLALMEPEFLQKASADLQSGAEVVEVGALLAAISYLSVPGTSLADIEYAGGFATTKSRQADRGSYYMPTAFTAYYDESDVGRKLVQDIFRTKLEPGWDMNTDYGLRRWFAPDKNGTYTRFQDFAFGYVVRSVTGESIGESYDPTVKTSASTHNMRLAEQFGDALYAAAYSSESFGDFVDEATARDTVETLRTPLPRNGKNRPHYSMGPNQRTYRGNVRRMLSFYFKTIDLKDQGEIKEEDQKELERRIRAIAVTLFGDTSGRSDKHVHHMLRLALGRPAKSKDDESEASRIKLPSLNIGLTAMEANIKNGYSPLRGGAVSLLPLEIRNAIITANFGKTETGGWAPRIYDKNNRISKDRARTPDQFTRAFFDHSLADPAATDIPTFKQIMDGVFHQYQEMSADLQSLPVSLDMMRDLDLLRKDALSEKEFEKFFKNKISFAQFSRENPDLVKDSIYHTTETMLKPQVLHKIAASAAMAQHLGLADAEMLDLDAPSAELLNYVQRRYESYARGKDIPFVTKASTRALRDTNSTQTDNHSNSHRMFRNLLALHGGKALFNPALGLGAIIDAMMRLAVSDTRRMLTGDSIGMVGSRVSRVVGSQGMIGSLAHGLGWRVMYTPKQTEELKRILNSTALTGAMNDVIYEQLTSYTSELNQSGVIRPIAALNKMATTIQDFGHGTKSKAMRRTYLQAAIADAVLRQGATLDVVLAGLAQDGAYLDRNYGASSRAGVQAMNDIRGTQDTVISSTISALIEPATKSGNAGVNAVAQMTLAMPLMFQRYASNLFLTLTGARAIDMLAAHALHGRNKPGLWHQISAKARSENLEANPTIDMTDVIGGLDAMDAVINMGITHSFLFTGGLVLGGLGLGGEDEEEKRRRRAAAAQGAVWLSDPRDIENDWRNAHALFLDEIPGLNVLFANDAGRAIASPHWILKPLTSPLLGMSRFMETGDMRQLKWGFEDAITSMPLLNMVTLNKALTMSEELSHAAQDSAAEGNLGASDSAGFLTHLVSYYESALFESSFLNAIYVGMDDYDRDPYVMPLRDSDGDLQRDAEGNVRANSDQHLRSEGLDGRGLALQSYVDDDGNVKEGYFTESDASTKSRIMAESRLSFAVVSSLFTGLMGKGGNTRYDMAVKTRKVDKPELSQGEEMAVVLGAYVAEANAELLKGGKQSAEQAVALSFLNNYGEEVLSSEGAEAIFRGLAGGSVTAKDASLQGVYIDFETRQGIQTKWMDELVMEGMNLGLSESSAKSRAYKVWNGSGDLPGIADILWSKDISYSKVQEFQQLNTTYLRGPDGNIWATGFERNKLLGAMGLAPLTGMHTSADTHTDMDGRMNVSGFGINNTGMRSLRPVNDSLDTPTDAEVGDAITKAIEDLNLTDYSGGYGGYRRGGGGGGGYAQRPVNNFGYLARWTNQNFNPISLRVPYANDVYSIRTDNVRTDLSTIRRERISSDRGRLTQWQ